MSGRRRQAGRIRTCDRDTNDIVELLGNDVSIDNAHQVMVRSTEKLEINQKLQNEYRNRISHIYKFLETHYPDYYAVGVRFLTDADKDNLDQHWNKNDRDLIYQGLNVKFIKAFMSHAKKKEKWKNLFQLQYSQVQGCYSVGIEASIFSFAIIIL